MKFQNILCSTHDLRPVLIVDGEMVKENSFLFTVQSGKADFGVFNFKYNKGMGLQPNGNVESASGWFDIVYTELALLIGTYHENPQTFNLAGTDTIGYW